MQDLTLIQDDDTMHLRRPEPHLRTSASGLETVDDSGNNSALLLFHQGSCQRA